MERTITFRTLHSVEKLETFQKENEIKAENSRTVVRMVQ